MIIFSQMDGLGFLGDDKVSFYAKTSFGNMGFASSVCSRTIIDWRNETMQLNFQC